MHKKRTIADVQHDRACSASTGGGARPHTKRRKLIPVASISKPLLHADGGGNASKQISSSTTTTTPHEPFTRVGNKEWDLICDDGWVTAPEDGNDFACLVCNKGGRMVLCDGCPSCFHPACLVPPLSFRDFTSPSWHCPECEMKASTNVSQFVVFLCTVVCFVVDSD